MFKFVMTKNSSEIFHRAILHNDVSRTRLILEEAMKDPRFNIDEINEEGLTGLQYSCFAGNLEIVEILVSSRGNWKIRDRDGYTLLHAAAMAGHGAIIRYLLRLDFKPTVKSDDGQMPIDVTDEIAIVVILLRAMLDQGFLQEMQDYMMDHPKLKRKIFKELELVKCKEKEKNAILKDLPYTSHTTSRKRVERLKQDGGRVRSKSTFSELSDSIQNLDKITEYNDNNNNNLRKVDVHQQSQTRNKEYKKNTRPLHRQTSNSSSSSHGSKSSYHSSGGILKTEKYYSDGLHKSTQRYLEKRFPLDNNKTVTFDVQSYTPIYSDGYISHNFDETSRNKRVPPTMSRSSGFSSHSSRNESCNSFVYEEPIYANAQALNPSLPSIAENIYENLPNNRTPPLPPRMPKANSSEHFRSSNDINYNSYEDPVSVALMPDRQMGSETDSGIDINETAGRVLALSLDDRREQFNELQDVFQAPHSRDVYSKPMGLYYSEQHKTASVRQQQVTVDDNLPCGFFVRPTNGLNSKYKSWNGRTLQEETQLTPYTSRRKLNNEHHSSYRNQNLTPTPELMQYREYEHDPQHYPQSQYHHDNRDVMEVYNFDHQPEIML